MRFLTKKTCLHMDFTVTLTYIKIGLLNCLRRSHLKKNYTRAFPRSDRMSQFRSAKLHLHAPNNCRYSIHMIIFKPRIELAKKKKSDQSGSNVVSRSTGYMRGVDLGTFSDSVYE